MSLNTMLKLYLLYICIFNKCIILFNDTLLLHYLGFEMTLKG